MYGMNSQQVSKRNQTKENRIEEIDLMRGIPILVVVLYHFCWTFYQMMSLFQNRKEMFQQYPNLSDFVSFLGVDILGGRNIVIQDFIVPLVGGLFIFVCGISSILARNNRKRALLLWICALAISGATYLVSYIIQDDCFIDWGVIHLMAFSVSTYALLEWIFSRFQRKVPVQLCLLIAGVIFFFAIITSSGYNIFTGEEFRAWKVKSISGLFPERYKNASYFFLQALGKYEGVTDWWPILPYTGVFYFGVTIGKLLYEENRKSRLPFLRSLYVFRPLCFIGRHTIWIYVLHQPIIIAVLFVIFSIMGFRL